MSLQMEAPLSPGVRVSVAAAERAKELLAAHRGAAIANPADGTATRRCARALQIVASAQNEVEAQLRMAPFGHEGASLARALNARLADFQALPQESAERALGFDCFSGDLLERMRSLTRLIAEVAAPIWVAAVVSLLALGDPFAEGRGPTIRYRRRMI